MIADHFQYWTIPLLIVTRFKRSFLDEYINVDMKLIHKSTIALSYIV